MIKQFNTLVYFIIMLLIVSCQSPEDKTSIENRIKKDVNTGLSLKNLLGTSVPGKPSTVYQADKDHSSISFRSKHWEIVDLIGWLDEFDVVMYSDSSDFSDAVIFASADIRSLKMPNIKMQQSVQHEPYIDTETYPLASFRSSSFIPKSENTYLLKGKIKLNGIEKDCQFDVTFNGYAYPGEKTICGFDVSGSLNRNHFNFGGDATLHSGKKIHDDTIHLDMSLRME